MRCRELFRIEVGEQLRVSGADRSGQLRVNGHPCSVSSAGPGLETEVPLTRADAADLSGTATATKCVRPGNGHGRLCAGGGHRDRGRFWLGCPEVFEDFARGEL
jgi:hypothetical protein